MLVLSIDTATLVSSVALATQDTLLAELVIQTRKTHSETLMPHIAEVLDMARISKQDIEGIAVSIGPGSFTGLRIGLATAKALAYALKIPIVGISTFEALAYNCPVPEVFLSPILDAQKHNVYQAVFSWQQDGLTEVVPARVVSIKQAIEEAALMARPVVMFGEAAVMYQAEIKAQGTNLILPPPHVVIPHAGSTAILGGKLLAQGITHDVMHLEPVYIRRSEAEELWERRQGASICKQ